LAQAFTPSLKPSRNGGTYFPIVLEEGTTFIALFLN